MTIGDDFAGRPAISLNGNTIQAAGADISVYSLAGTRVAAAADAVSIESLASGIYIVKAQTAQGETVCKIVK